MNYGSSYRRKVRFILSWQYFMIACTRHVLFHNQYLSQFSFLLSLILLEFTSCFPSLTFLALD